MKITVELTANEAAALARLCEKFHHGHAQSYLYGHVSTEIRSDQAYDMIRATDRVAKALADANVRGWPWIETGTAD